MTNASPATISRMGVIYFSESDMDYNVIVNQWLRNQRAESQALLQPLIDKYLFKCTNILTYIQALIHLI